MELSITSPFKGVPKISLNFGDSTFWGAIIFAQFRRPKYTGCQNVRRAFGAAQKVDLPSRISQKVSKIFGRLRRPWPYSWGAIISANLLNIQISWGAINFGDFFSKFDLEPLLRGGSLLVCPWYCGGVVAWVCFLNKTKVVNNAWSTAIQWNRDPDHISSLHLSTIGVPISLNCCTPSIIDDFRFVEKTHPSYKTTEPV